MISFIQNEVVVKQPWLSGAEFTDIVAVSQMTPGPLGINLATYTGYMAPHNVWGAVVATVAVCLPAFIFMILLSKYFIKNQHNPRVQQLFKVLRPVVIGLIASAALVLMNKENFTDYKSILIFAVAFMLTLHFKVSPVRMIVLAGMAGFLFY